MSSVVPKLKPGDLVKWVGEEMNEEYGVGMLLSIERRDMDYKIYWPKKQHTSYESIYWADHPRSKLDGTINTGSPLSVLMLEKLS